MEAKRLCTDCQIICPIVNKDQCPLNLIVNRAEELSKRAEIRDLEILFNKPCKEE